MTSTAAFQEKFNRFVALCSEDYLVRHANKGLYNRALKDMDKGMSVGYEWGDSSVRCRLDDGTECTLEADLEHPACSCPAETMCKHILIAILYYAANAAPAPGSFSEPDAKEPLKTVNIGESSVIDTVEDEPTNTDINVRPNASTSHPSQADDANRTPTSSELAEAAGGTGPADRTEAAVGNPIALHNGLGEDVSKQQAKADLSLPARFGWMLEAGLSPILSSFSASVVEEALFRLRFHEDITVNVDTLLTVGLSVQGIEVSFKEDGKPAKALCKTKGRAGELARLEALLRYRLMHGLDDGDALDGIAYTFSYSSETVAECLELMREMMATGLARLPESYSARLETLAVAAHSSQLPEVERSLRGIQGELGLFFKRHVRFSMKALNERVTRLYLALELLQRDEMPARQQARLVGVYRTGYYAVPRLRLFGLGAEPWQTRSGYRGITYYLYGLDDGKLYTYSEVRATYYEEPAFDFDQQYAGFSPWLPHLTMKDFSESQMEFRDVKINLNRRLSSGESGKLSLLARQAADSIDFGELLQNADSLRLWTGAEPLLFGEPREQMAVIRMAKVAYAGFDKQTQRLFLDAEDVNGDPLLLTLPYHEDWSRAFKRLENSETLSRLNGCYAFVRVARDSIMPISFLKDTLVWSLKMGSS